MKHEELVERVAEGIRRENCGSDSRLEPLENLPIFIRERYRTQAREAIRITGEACGHICTSKVPHYSTNELIDDSTDGHHSGVVYAKAILSLTQGNKT